ncbi:MAG: hypothetical protein ACNI27_13145 [Desulfovibrio sp.]
MNSLNRENSIYKRVFDFVWLHSLYCKLPRGGQKVLTAIKYTILAVVLFPRFLRYYLVIRRSGLFWDEYYRSAYPEIGKANPLAHFIRYGAAKRYNPNPLFVTWWYLEENRDVESNGCNPLYHYIQHGWREGRSPSAEFDGDRYLAANLDVAKDGINPLRHFLKYGCVEDRGY